MNRTIWDKARLNNGIEMPFLGLGVYLAAAGNETRQAIQWSLEAGYRHIDTAKIYGNERDVGLAIQHSDLPREEIFVTTKLWNSDHGYDNTLRAFEDSLGRLGLSYVDLYLIHWPVEGLRAQSWKALLTLLEEGTCQAVGVSNYTIHHLKELLADSPVVPAVNQVEFSPFLYQQELLEFCRTHSIQLEAYSPLTRCQKFHHPTITSLADKYGQTPAQIMIRWALQHDVVVIPKSADRQRIRENAAVFDFDITPDDMARLNACDENFRVSWDPTNTP
ncbi:MAG: aldo/keto reductase [Fidelibacterota bacterium]|nr:MAG: aldo/keto reductase [Candidatus Neomarinimicrobiota bacterium]